MLRTFRVDDWTAQPELNRLTRGDQVAKLEPKVMQVLECLAARPGEVVTREELVRAVWGDVFVTDDVVHRAVGELRKALGDRAATPRYVETIRKRGYRLIAETDTGSAPAFTTASQELPSPQQPNREVPRPSVPGFFLWGAGALTVIVAAGILALGMRTGTVATNAHAQFVPLVAGPVNETDPAPGPDGRLAFVMRERPGIADAGQADIYVLDPSATEPRRFTSHPADDRLPAWSPDGQQIAFVRIDGARCDMLVRPAGAAAAPFTADASADSHGERVIAPCANADEPRLAWSADGRWLIHSAAPDAAQHRGWQLARTAVATGARETLTLPSPDAIGDHSPSVAPDGSVAFIRAISGGVADVFILSPTGGAPRRVTFDDGDVAGVAFADEGREIVYSSDRAGGYSVWRAPVDGGEAQLVAGGAAKLKHPVATADRVIYESWAYEINVWQAPVGAGPGAPPQPVIRTSDLWNFYGEPSPDNTQVAFISTRSGSQELWVADRMHASPRQLTRFGRAALRAPRWSPDGTRIVLAAMVRSHADLFIVDVANGNVTQLTSDAGDEVAPEWSRDGSRVYYGARRDGVWSVWSISRPRETPSMVVEGGYAAQEAPDGSGLYFTRADRAGLWFLPRGGADARAVLPSIAAGAWATWRIAPEGIVYVGVTDDAPVARKASLDGSNVRDVAALPDYAWPGVALSPDGRFVLYGKADRRESNIMAAEVSSSAARRGPS